MNRTSKFLAAGTLAGLFVLVAGCSGGGAPAAPAAAEPTAPAAGSPVAENPPAQPPQPEPLTPPPAKAEVEKPRPAPKPAPAPAPAPQPEPIVKTVAAGTPIELELIDGASSKTSQVGDAVSARVAKDVVVDGVVVLAAGTRAFGSVTEAVPLKKIGGQAKLAVEFNRVEREGEATSIAATYAAEGEKQSGKDAAKIGGAAAAGALLGRVLSDDKTKGTAIGAVVGAAAGTAAAAKTGQNNDVEFAPGAMLVVTLNAPVQVTIRR
jgi:outer membrane biosynthesis protein TonB